MVDSLIAMIVWYEVFYNVNDTLPETLMSIAQGVGVAVAIVLVTFANLEVAMLLSERYRNARFNAGIEVGMERGVEKGREEERNRIREALRQSGVEITPELEKSLFGETGESSANGKGQ